MTKYANGPHIHRKSNTKVWITDDVAEFNDGGRYNFNDLNTAYMSGLIPATFSRADFEAEQKAFQEATEQTQKEEQAEADRINASVTDIRNKLTTTEWRDIRLYFQYYEPPDGDNDD